MVNGMCCTYFKIRCYQHQSCDPKTEARQVGGEDSQHVPVHCYRDNNKRRYWSPGETPGETFRDLEVGHLHHDDVLHDHASAGD